MRVNYRVNSTKKNNMLLGRALLKSADKVVENLKSIGKEYPNGSIDIVDSAEGVTFLIQGVTADEKGEITAMLMMHLTSLRPPNLN